MCFTCGVMAPLRLSAFRLPDDLTDAMQRLKDRDGIPLSVQVRRALQAFLAERGVLEVKAARKRVAPRKRA
jgi:hypothetical protein